MSDTAAPRAIDDAAARKAGAAAWRIVFGTGGGLDACTGPENMALDAALLESVQAGAPPVLRLYRWDPACLSFGRNQPALPLYDPDTLADAGIDAVRRPTGGLTVLHDAELTYAVIAPISSIGRPREAYRRINLWLVAALRSVGVEAAAAEGAQAPAWADGGAAHPCFAAPADGEVVAGGRKLVGSAQRTEAGCILQHGSIILDGDQDAVRRLQRVPGPPPVVPLATSVRLAAGRDVDVADLAAAIVAASAVGGTRLAPARLDPVERRRWRDLVPHFRSAAWTWRR